MQGTMMNYPLTLTHLLGRAAKLFARVEIVSQEPDKSLRRHQTTPGMQLGANHRR